MPPAGLACAVPFNVDVLRAAPEVFHVCDGPVDTLVAAQLGLAAVGVPHGVALRPRWLDRLGGVRRVVLLPHDDDAGGRMAAELSGQLRARDITVEVLPMNVPENAEDLRRHLQAPGCWHDG
jgi:hypothetical protein